MAVPHWPPGLHPGGILPESRMSKAITLARKPSAARKYLQTFRRLQKLSRAFECERGHFACAADPNGACTEELLRLIGSADDGDAQPRS
jgi:hypothetical protein